MCVVSGVVLGRLDIGLSVDGLHHEGSQDQVALLLSAIALDEEAALLDDAVQAHLLAVPLVGLEAVEVLLD